MDNEVLYFSVIVLGLLITVYSILTKAKPKSKVNTRKDIIKSYQKEIKDAIKGLEYEKEERTTRKRLLIKKYNDELSRNIFFDKSEIKDILAELARI